MTLNSVIARIKKIATAHKQVRTFRRVALLGDFMADKTIKYPAIFLQGRGGSISTSGHATTVNYRMFIYDLVHVSEETLENEQDVQSDTLSIAMDLVAQLNNGNYDDWALSSENVVQDLVESDNDMAAGWYVDFSFRIMFSQNVCQAPTELTEYSPTDTDMKYVYDIEYIATGTEGSTLTIPEIANKRILMLTRDSGTVYKVTNLPDSTQYTWDNATIGLGTTAAPGQRFLILYRNY